ncbi:hypothetical protein AQUSIP_07200 [Aquicella siphonis]|uniref:Outer membrane protein beta-barrel domain-containing protein n=1 Tax=Aquicella siphonis TaxID=254247 RepID=A0A5E4PEM7_9COXI|nr:Lpg1974 family pore-forming outer membrane protein [Aquicella siphonis]VVC75430.1 hypothetical protein AQUSIP_07200 [Aquicella siphonis]
MKEFFKRSAISVIVLGVTASASAGMPGNNTPWTTHFSGAFIGVEGLNLRPMNGDLDYVTIFPANSGGSFYTRGISTSYDWGWRVFGGINFTENDDLTLSWFSMNTSDSDSVSPAGSVSGFGPSAPRWIGGNNIWNNVTGRVTFDLDDAYAVWGHTINFSNPWSVRFAGGLEYAKLHSKLRIASDSSYSGESNIGFEAKNETKGIGPRVELDMTYHLPYGFALFGNTNAALLVSDREISLDPTVAVSHDIFDNTYINYSSDFTTRKVVIPRFGMRLGASYSYVWGQAGGEGAPCRTTTLTVDAGWQVESYIHAIERPDNGYFDVTTNNVRAMQAPDSGFAGTKTSNFSDQGLFVGVRLGTDWV